MRSASSAVTTRATSAFRSRYDAETVACPGDRPLTTPSASTATTSGRVDDHVASNDTTGACPDRRRATATHGPLCPISSDVGQDTSTASTSAPLVVAPPLGEVGAAPPHDAMPIAAMTPASAADLHAGIVSLVLVQCFQRLRHIQAIATIMTTIAPPNFATVRSGYMPARWKSCNASQGCDANRAFARLM